MEQNENYVCVGGWLLFSDGEMRESSTTGYGMIKKPENAHEKSKLIVKFWEIKLELAVEEFDDRKSSWLASARARMNADGNPGGAPVAEEEAVALLTELKRKVMCCQKKLDEAEAELEKNTPTQLRQNQDISEQNRQRLGDFVAAVESIEI